MSTVGSTYKPSSLHEKILQTLTDLNQMIQLNVASQEDAGITRPQRDTGELFCPIVTYVES